MVRIWFAVCVEGRWGDVVVDPGPWPIGAAVPRLPGRADRSPPLLPRAGGRLGAACRPISTRRRDRPGRRWWPASPGTPSGRPARAYWALTPTWASCPAWGHRARHGRRRRDEPAVPVTVRSTSALERAQSTSRVRGTMADRDAPRDALWRDRVHLLPRLVGVRGAVTRRRRHYLGGRWRDAATGAHGRRPKNRYGELLFAVTVRDGVAWSTAARGRGARGDPLAQPAVELLDDRSPLRELVTGTSSRGAQGMTCLPTDERWRARAPGVATNGLRMAGYAAILTAMASRGPPGRWSPTPSSTC